MGFPVDKTHAWSLFDGRFQGGGRFVFDERGLEHFKRNRHFRGILLKATGGHHHQPKRLRGGFHNGVPGDGLACVQLDLALLLGHANERTHDGVLAGFERQRVGPVEVRGHGCDAVGQVGTDDRLVGAVEDAALDGLAPCVKGGSKKQSQGKEGGEWMKSHEAK